MMSAVVEQDLAGRTLSHYRLLQKIGEGGMGVVWQAEDAELGRTVALKILPQKLMADPERRQRFRREARSAAALNHPNIAVIHEIAEHEGILFIVMELIKGKSLRDRIREGPLRLAETLEIASSILEGLAHAHEQGIIHRDLKPDNVMITPEGQVKLLDFGLAKSLQAARPHDENGKKSIVETISADLTREGAFAGTVAYMSPELAQGMPVDARSDLFSFGVLLYEMAAGKRPFRGENWAATLVKVLEQEPEPLRSVLPGLPRELERIVHRCLRKRPADRHRDARELSRELGELARSLPSGLPVEAGRRGPSRTGRFIALGAAAAAFLALLIWAATSRMASRAPGPSTDPQIRSAPAAIAVLPFSVHGASQFAYLGEGMVNLLGTALDGAGALRAVDARAVLGAVARQGSGRWDPEDGEAIARQLGAGRFVVGDIVEAGGRLRIQASLFDARGGSHALARAKAEGTAEQVFEMVDSVAGQILAGQPAGPSERVTRVAAVTTHSIAALKSYLEGESEFRAGRFSEAVEAFQRAVAADPTFALAYYRLSIAAEWGSASKLSREAAEDAVRYSDRLSRHDRLLLEALLAWRRGATPEAERLYRTVLATYPDDVEAWFQFGEVLFHGGPAYGRPFNEAREPFERVVQFEPEHVPSLLHLARIAVAEGKPSELTAVVDRVLQLNPSGERVLEATAVRAFALDDRAEQEKVLEDLRRAPENLLLVSASTALTYSGKLRDSLPLARVLTDPERSPEYRALGHVWLADLEQALGRPSAAQAELEKVRPLNPAASLEYRALLATLPFFSISRSRLEAIREDLLRFDPRAVPDSVSSQSQILIHDGLHPLLRHHLLGLLEARLARYPEALQRASELERFAAPPEAGSLSADLARSIRAQVALGRGRSQEALSLLEKASQDLPYLSTIASPFFARPLDRFTRAELLRDLGRDDEALGWYGSFANYTRYDLIYLAPSHFHRAEILEKLSRPREAADEYQRFLDLWQDCDPGLRPLVDQAKTRLAKLRPEG